MNKNIVEGKWNEIKGEIRKTWGQLTDDELEKTKGDATAIGGLLQQRYGKAEDTYSEKLSNIFCKFESKKEEVVENTKSALKN